MIKRSLVCVSLILIFGLNSAFCQDTLITRQVLDSLTAPYMAGRGYTENGDKTASRFLADQLASIGIAPYKDDYFQNFYISVATINKVEYIKAGTKELKSGSEVIIIPGSPGTKGSFPVVIIDSTNVHKYLKGKKSLAGKFAVVDDKMFKSKNQQKAFEYFFYMNPAKATGMVKLCDKTLQLHNSEMKEWVEMEITRDAFPAGCKTISLSFESSLNPNYPVRNVCGFIRGKSDSVLVFTAHYDHVGKFGDAIFPGANDNASGSALLLDLGRYIKNQTDTLPYSVAFVFFTGEEIGLEGSSWFIKKPVFPLNSIRFVINLDMVGSGQEGITIVNGSVYKREFAMLTAINDEGKYLKEIKARGEAANSDHHPFHKKGIRSIFIYGRGPTGGYHHISDTPANMKLDGYSGLYKLMVDFIRKF